MIKTFKVFLKEKVQYLSEGGAALHMANVWEDTSLTFAQLKDIIHKALTGGLKNSTIKLDGQNLLFTVKDGKVVYARNPTQTKGNGANAITVEQLAQQFEGRQNLQDAFVNAAKDIASAIKATPGAAQLFNNGSRWGNIEILYAPNKNVIPYTTNKLVIHNLIDIDAEGNQTKKDVNAAKQLATKLKLGGKEVFKEIKGPTDVTFDFSKVPNVQAEEQSLLKELNSLMKKLDIKDNETILDNKMRFFSKKIDSFGIKGADKQKLLDRWLNGNKNAKDWIALKKTYPAVFPKIKAYEDGVDLNDRLSKDHKRLQEPLERIFLRLGAVVIKAMANYSQSDEHMQKAKQELEAEIDKTIQDVKVKGDDADKRKLEYELKRLESIGGLDMFIPEEGLVFPYAGRFLKLTGTYSPINKILGTLKYKMGGKKEEV